MSESDRPKSDRPGERPLRSHLESLPDIDEVTSHPIFLKLEKMSDIFFAPSKQQFSFDAKSDEEIVEGAKQEFQNARALSELLFRTRKGSITLRTLVMNFPEEEIKKLVLGNLNFWHAFQLRPIDELEGVLKQVVQEKIVTTNELLASAQNEDFRNYVLERLSASGAHVMKAFYASNPPPAAGSSADATPSANVAPPTPVPAETPANPFAPTQLDIKPPPSSMPPRLPSGAQPPPAPSTRRRETIHGLAALAPGAAPAPAPTPAPAANTGAKSPPPPPSSRHRNSLLGVSPLTPGGTPPEGTPARARRRPTPVGLHKPDLDFSGGTTAPDDSTANAEPAGRYRHVAGPGGNLLDAGLLKKTDTPAPPPPPETVRISPAAAAAMTEPVVPPARAAMPSEPMMGFSEHSAAEVTPENPNVVRLPVVIHINADSDFIRCPLLFDDQIHTIGTDPACDILLPESYKDRVRPLHAEVKMENGQMYLRGVKGAVKIQSQPRVVLTEWRAISNDDAFYLGAEDKDDVPCLLAEHSFDLSKDQLKTYMRGRFNQLLEAYHASTFNLLHAKSSTGSGEKKDVVKEAARIINETSEKLNNLLAAGQKMGVEFYSKTEITGLKYASAKPITDYVHQTISRYAEIIGEETLKYVKANLETITGEIDHLFPLQIEEAKKAIEKINNLLDFAEKHKLPIISEEDQRKKIEAALAPARNVLATRREELAEQKRIADEAAQSQIEIYRGPLDRHNKRHAQLEEFYGKGKFHYAVDQELLNEDSEVVHVGPAIIISDPFGKKEIYPILTEHETLGGSIANTIELDPIVDRKRGTKPFMARIDYDAKEGKFMYTWIDGSCEKEQKDGIISSPIFPLAYDEKIIIGRFHLLIEPGHAYTMKALQVQVNREAEELIEVIFDQDRTTQEQNDDSMETIKSFVSLGLVDKTALGKKFVIEITKLWEAVGQWRTSRPVDWDLKDLEKPEGDDRKLYRENALQDAHYLSCLQALVKDAGVFLPKLTLTEELIKDQALRRVHAFASLDREASAVDTTTLRWLRKVSPANVRVAETDKRRAEARLKADIGAVQIARFLEFGMVKLQDLQTQDGLSQEYLDIIQRAARIRELLELFKRGGAGINAITNLQDVGRGVRMREVFSVDEINIANQNIEMSFNADSLLEDYLHKLAVFIGRQAFRDALSKEDVREEVKTLRLLVSLGHLRKSDLIIPEFNFNLEKVKEALDEIMFNADEMGKDEIRNEQRRRKNIEARTSAKEQNHQKRMNLVAEAAKVGAAINEVRLKARLEILLDVAHIIGNSEIAEEMDTEKIMTEAIHIDLPLYKSDAPDRMQGITAQRQLFTWKEVERVYKELALDLAKDTVSKIRNGEDSAYNALLIKQGVEQGIFNEQDLNTSLVQIEAEIQAERKKLRLVKYRRKHLDKFNTWMNGPVDDLDYLDQIKVEDGTDDEEKKVLKELLDSVSWQKMNGAIEKIKAGEDIAYMKLIAKQLQNSGYDPQDNFSAEQLALLQ